MAEMDPKLDPYGHPLIYQLAGITPFLGSGMGLKTAHLGVSWTPNLMLFLIKRDVVHNHCTRARVQ